VYKKIISNNNELLVLINRFADEWGDFYTGFSNILLETVNNSESLTDKMSRYTRRTKRYITEQLLLNVSMYILKYGSEEAQQFLVRNTDPINLMRSTNGNEQIKALKLICRDSERLVYLLFETRPKDRCKLAEIAQKNALIYSQIYEKVKIITEI